MLTQIMLHKKVHFIGIGGISMSALAELLLSHGVLVTGSDQTGSALTDRLVQKGAIVFLSHKAKHIQSPDLVVYTAAIDPQNPELIAAREAGIPTLERAEFLGEFMTLYQKPISVSGTHGKTTTTSMLSCVLLEAGVNPTILIGGELPQIGGTLHIGSTKHLVFEACEYVDSFLKFNPYAALVLNIEEDHLDYFSGIEQIKQSFNRFMKLIPPHGFVVLNADDENVMDSLKDVSCKQITYGKQGMFRPANIVFGEDGCPAFDIQKDGETLSSVTLSVTGVHNIWNALAVFAAATELGVSPDDIVKGIRSFHGTRRRFEKRGMLNGAVIYDDYAHHPTEIATTIDAAKKMPHGNIHCVFQPHTYTRTKAFLDDFAAQLSKANQVIITDIYAAREQNTVGIHARDLADKIDDALYFSDFEQVAQHLRKTVKPGDIVLTMGAGTITSLPDLLQ